MACGEHLLAAMCRDVGREARHCEPSSGLLLHPLILVLVLVLVLAIVLRIIITIIFSVALWHGRCAQSFRPGERPTPQPVGGREDPASV